MLPALFVIVAGALASAALVQMLGASNQSTLLVNSQLRAQQAARAALESTRYRIDRSNACVTGTLNMVEGALSGFRVRVTCARASHDDGGVPRVTYALTAFAQYARFGQPDYVSFTETALLRR
jgi:Tfp pilus assembly protein PilV